ncbi:MAG TPA: LysR family transcriptional regulator [Xanthobacteraceae bacterium]|nr:LysR family transcriptional regulator [Xanthobacteraceae bacterium]
MQLSERIGKRIKLQDVHILMAVAEAGSMGKAARHLNTSQPNISKSIADLEHALGVRLLDRHSQGIAPTKYGRALLDGGTAVFDALRQTLKNIEFLADPAAGEVRIGCNELLATSFGSTVVDRLSRRFPRIKFHLVTGHNDVLHHQLCERQVDLLIAWRFGPVADERLFFESLFDETCVVAAGAQSQWAKRRRTIPLSALINEPWVLPPRGSGIITVALEAFRASGLDYPSATVVTDSPNVRMNLLATGRFLTILQVSALRLPRQRLELCVLPVKLPMAPIPCGVVTLKNRTLSPVVRLFIDAAREVARPLMKRNDRRDLRLAPGDGYQCP